MPRDNTLAILLFFESMSRAAKAQQLKRASKVVEVVTEKVKALQEEVRLG